MLGEPDPASEVAARARREHGADRLAMLAAASRICRERAEGLDGGSPRAAAADGDVASAQAGAGETSGLAGAGEAFGLAAAVARELAASTARLPERQREALALRELLALSYQQISQVMGIETTAVAPLLAQSRLRLRAERRGVSAADADCQDRERALRLLACRQDSEALSADDDAWVLAHMAGCVACETAHAAMLEASVCYRAWPRG